MAKPKNAITSCQCHSCEKINGLMQLMTAQNELMTKIVDQNGVLLDLVLSDESEDKDPMRSLD
ncbi:hypothetical protein HYG93_07605 [Acinetobacter sp. SwsAc6]|uniref:hypothetical protein n=1 Tax=Acinetobacter sp. SwsAc6 TaxID=2749439 RepID=UPI0015C04258|nr:hypothetical protein [Acinetobacter sp. SwsAc6]NWK74155.1 hypothetical protein [Acinetobacter sp. SwsAc6]